MKKKSQGDDKLCVKKEMVIKSEEGRSPSPSASSSDSEKDMEHLQKVIVAEAQKMVFMGCG